MEKIFYAHSKEEEPPSEWQLLENHLENVGMLTEQFAGSFGAQAWGNTSGRFHDAGKGTSQWQAWLRHVSAVKNTERSVTKLKLPPSTRT